MNIDMNLALTITFGILAAGAVKHFFLVVLDQVFGGSKSGSNIAGSAKG